MKRGCLLACDVLVVAVERALSGDLNARVRSKMLQRQSHTCVLHMCATHVCYTFQTHMRATSITPITFLAGTNLDCALRAGDVSMIHSTFTPDL